MSSTLSLISYHCYHCYNHCCKYHCATMYPYAKDMLSSHHKAQRQHPPRSRVPMMEHTHDDLCAHIAAVTAHDEMLAGHDCSNQDPTFSPFEESRIYELLPGRLSFTAHRDDDCTIAEIKAHPNLFFFSSCWQESYEPLCADFGPINLSGVYCFCQEVCQFMTDARLAKRNLVFYTQLNSEHLTNSAFLLSAFLVVICGYEPEDAVRPFAGFNPTPFLDFRDATFMRSDYGLSILDCLHGLKQAMKLGFLCAERFDVNEYETLYSPEFDMNQPCAKFIAFRGPSEREQDTWAKPPSQYIQLLKAKGVTAVVRLNEPDTYDPNEFRQHGINHYDLEFDDCTVPSAAVVSRFLDLVDAEAGVIAVHCKAGLGRTGTLIGLWMMKHYGLRADETIAWLRIARPGSVIGPQQHFLKRCEHATWHGNHLLQPDTIPDAAASKLLARQVVEGMSAKLRQVQ